MKTVKIFKVECTKAFQMGEQGEGFSLSGWGENTPYYEGHDDGGHEYILPDGFRVGITVDLEKAIFHKSEKYALDLIMHSSGRPQIITQSSGWPVLQMVSKETFPSVT